MQPIKIILTALTLTLMLAGCGRGFPNLPDWTEGHDTSGGSVEGTSTGPGSGASSGADGSSTGGGSSGGSSGEEPAGLHEPCEPMVDEPCEAPLVCYVDSVTETLTMCTLPCEDAGECQGLDDWPGAPACGDDGLCRHPCDETEGTPLCPPGWECLFEGTDDADSQVFNCLPFECPDEPC